MNTLLVQHGRTVVCHSLYLSVGAENIKTVLKCHLNRGKTDEILLKTKNVKLESGTSICIPAIDVKRLLHKGIEIGTKKVEKNFILFVGKH